MGDDGGLVVVPAAAAVQVLNSAGSRIYGLLDGKHSQDEIVRTIVDEYDVSEDVVRSDLQSFLAGLDVEGMLVAGDDSSGPKVKNDE